MSTLTTPSRTGIITEPQLLAMSENFLFSQDHGMREFDVLKVNRIVKAIEDRTFSKKPTINAGDGIELHGDGHAGHVVYKNSRVSCGFGPKGGFQFCTQPSVPYIYDTLTVSQSGGYFGQIDQSKLEYMGIEKRMFWTFGHNGACANGGVYFEAQVHCWRYVDLEKIY